MPKESKIQIQRYVITSSLNICPHVHFTSPCVRSNS